MSINIKSILAILATSLLLFSCGNKKNTEEKLPEAAKPLADEVYLSKAQYQNAGIQSGLVQSRQISKTIKVNGVLDVPPQQLVSISAPMGGFVKQTDLLQGSAVTKGQVIAVLQNQEYIQLQQEYLETKSQYEYSLTEYERQQALAKENINAGKTLQMAKANYNSLQAKQNGIAERLKLINISPSALNSSNIRSTINIYAPISGYVMDVNINLGQMVGPTDVMFKIVDPKHLHAELTVFEKDVLSIRIGQKVRFTLANEARERTATVYLIGRDIDQNRTVHVHCHLDEEDKQLLPGMYLKAIVETNGTDVQALPDEAIVSFEGRKYIFQETAAQDKEEVHFKMLEVATGESDEGYTEILLPKNFDSKLPVVIKGAYSLLSKMKNSEEEE